MPSLSKTFEFYNPYSTNNSHTTQPSITMPQMVNGRNPDPVLTLYSGKLETAKYYGLKKSEEDPTWDYTVAYTIEGSFMGTVRMQSSTSPNPVDQDWTDVPDSAKTYTGLETTGGAGISGGFSASISRPIRTDFVNFNGEYTWVRVRLDISRGTLQAVKYNF